MLKICEKWRMNGNEAGLVVIVGGGRGCMDECECEGILCR